MTTSRPPPDEAENPPFGPFAPPYELGGSSVVVVGLWEKEPDALVPEGFRRLRLFGRSVAMIVANDYEEPPPELPIPYREVVVASLVYRGASVAAWPIDMVLDREPPVTLGHLHYSLPKRLDEAMTFERRASRLVIEASGLRFAAREHGLLARACALPMGAWFSLGVRLVTGAIDVIGTADAPPKRARITLAPAGIGQSLRVDECLVNGVGIRSLWCQSWRWTTTHLGAPRELEE